MRPKTIALVLIGAAASFGQPHPKVARDLESRDPHSTVNVIVQFTRSPEQRHFDRIRQHGGQHRQALSLVNGALVSIPAENVATLADDPDVAMISPDHIVTGSLDHVAGSINGYTLANYFGSTVYSKEPALASRSSTAASPPLTLISKCTLLARRGSSTPRVLSIPTPLTGTATVRT